MLHEQLAEFLREDVVCRGRDGAEGDEDFVCGGEVGGGWEEGGGVGEDGHGVGRLAFWEEGDADGDEFVVVREDEAVEEGATVALNSGGGACEPRTGDSEDFNISAFDWERWNGCEGAERRES